METTLDIQLAEAERLKAIYKARKQGDRSLTQERVAELCGWSGQSAVSQYMTGKIPLNIPALVKLAQALKFDPRDVSPRLADLTAASSNSAPSAAGPLSANEHPSLHPIEVWDDQTPLGPDEVELPFYKEVELSAGKGSEVMLETAGRKLRFGRRSLQRKGVSAETAACAAVTGNSMEPVLPDGSTVGIDTAATQVQDGKMYAIDHSGQLRVKLLYRLPAGGLRVRSYNEDEHPDERYEAEYVTEHIRIIGKVFWYSVLL
ncbi:helix-turn-helix transcriptional regulator [Pseudomonas sp. SG20056]|uniref:LexA family transcriptional regulator n=1 Tax=Pseudomonas sp. SG20056 TaxID=3074146 RepID=UPI00287F6738|nr:helix-turn-helix transcriptional regulator [Pseudomonas sp. SG20056]WNF45836.1 helix-turn-helix transcriptional regulator [Pseudomonas sp. SG20056]